MDDDFCSYPNCERHTDLEQCKYCKKYFCYKHVNPMQVNYQPHLFRKERKELDDKSHKCKEFNEQFEKEKKSDNDKKSGRKIDENLIRDIYETVKGRKYKWKSARKLVEKGRKPILYAFGGIVVIAILVVIVYFVMNLDFDESQQPIKKPKTVLVNKTATIYETVFVKSSFDDYLKDKEKYDNTIVTLTGFLRYKFEGSGTSGSFQEVVVDDNGNEISLVNVPSLYRKLFVKRETTKELYNVTGTFKRAFKDANIDADKIQITERQTTILEKQTTILMDVTE